MADAKHLEAALRQLRSEIATLGIGDDEARRRLDALVRDIEATLADPRRAAGSATLGERVQSSVLVFEASHPRVAAILNEVMQQLGNMGI